MRPYKRLLYALPFPALFTGYYLLFHHEFSLWGGHVLCPFRRLTTLPCPACGSLRATNLFLHGNIVEGFAMNPLALFTNLMLIGLSVGFLFDALQNRDRVMPLLHRPWPRPWLWVLAVVIIGVWIYQLFFNPCL